MRITLYVCLLLLFSMRVTLAADIQSYYTYRDAVELLQKNLINAERACEKKDEVTCANKEQYVRNLILQRIIAYQEYYDDLISNYGGVFPTNLTAFNKELANHANTIKEAKHYTTLITDKNLSSLEKTVNSMLKQDAVFLQVLSAGFHFQKTKEMYVKAQNTHENLSHEAILAKKAGVDTQIVQRHLDSAKKDLDNASLIFAKMDNLSASQNSSLNVKEIQKDISQIYSLLISANTNMLKAGEILQRFSKKNYW